MMQLKNTLKYYTVPQKIEKGSSRGPLRILKNLFIYFSRTTFFAKMDSLSHFLMDLHCSHIILHSSLKISGGSESLLSLVFHLKKTDKKKKNSEFGPFYYGL